MVLTGRADPQTMRSIGTEQFREADRVTRKNWLGWIIPGLMKRLVETIFSLSYVSAQ